MNSPGPKAMVWIGCALALLLGCSQPATPAPISTTAPFEESISGIVFRDLNGDGVRDLREQGEQGVSVSAYDANNRLVATTTTDHAGNYVLRAQPHADKINPDRIYRVEFGGWQEPLQPGPQGKDSGTEMQFAPGGASDVHFGLFSPDQYTVRKRAATNPQASEGQGVGKTPSTQPAVPTSTPDPAAAPGYDGPFAGSVPAPDFPPGLDWLNTERPLTYADLRGKVVLLEFWTFGCIACVKMIPQLKRLQETFSKELVIIGVHAAKFPHESQTANIRHFVQRYEIEYPVVNDHEYRIAGEYQASIWPTLVLVNPVGRYVGARTGRDTHSQLARSIGEMVAAFDGQGLIDRTPLAPKLGRETLVDTPLRFPGAVLADTSHDRLFIADSAHNRVIVTDLSGRLLSVIGNGEPELRDGDFETASFNHPQGLALADRAVLYVVDTKNHAIRRVDLAEGTVETVAGDGHQGYMGVDAGNALTTRLNYPGDLLYLDGLLYVTMIGQHQVWIYDPEREEVRAFAGSRQQALTDGPLLRAAFNQPSALTTDGSVLYVADSEASAIRQVDLDLAGRVQTLVGQGFFLFGDVDGSGEEVRLQRPGGLVHHKGVVYVADSYNNKIKTLDPQTGEVRSLLGTGRGGWRDGPEPLFAEPSGLDAAGDRLYVADTNNHVVRVVDLEGGIVSTLVLVDDLGLLAAGGENRAAGQELLLLEPQIVAPGPGEIRLHVRLPGGYKVNEVAPSLFRWQGAEHVVRLEAGEAERIQANPAFPLVFRAEFLPGNGELAGDAYIYYCSTGAEALCFVEEVRFAVPVSVSRAAGPNVVLVEYVVEVH